MTSILSNKLLWRRLHRWIALLFGLPLLVVVVTGAILSVEPMLGTAAIRPGSLDLARAETLLAKADPAGQARTFMVRPLDGQVMIGAGPGRGRTFDIATAEPATGGSPLSALFGTSRRLHETMLLDLGWLVTASTVAMLVLIALGVLMGLPRLRNTLGGWHKGIGWFGLPLAVLSPLTGLLIALGVTFGAGPPAAGPAVPLAEAVRLVARDHDLSRLTWIRRMGSGMLARINVDGEQKLFAVSAEGLRELPRNWPRLLHEGTIGGFWMGIANLATALGLLALLVTGVWIWARARLSRRARAGRRPLPA